MEFMASILLMTEAFTHETSHANLTRSALAACVRAVLAPCPGRRSRAGVDQRVAALEAYVTNADPGRP